MKWRKVEQHYESDGLLGLKIVKNPLEVEGFPWILVTKKFTRIDAFKLLKYAKAYAEGLDASREQEERDEENEYIKDVLKEKIQSGEIEAFDCSVFYYLSGRFPELRIDRCADLVTEIRQEYIDQQ